MSEIRIPVEDPSKISDGYHTFGELYDHRIELWLALCRTLHTEIDALSWRSRLHSDGSSFEGWFVLGWRQVRGKQITYHLPIDRWDDARFATTLEKAPEWDGHTSADVLGRLKII